MFYNNRAILKTILGTVCKTSKNSSFINNVDEVFTSIDASKIKDLDCKDLVEMIKNATSTIRVKGIFDENIITVYCASNNKSLNKEISDYIKSGLLNNSLMTDMQSYMSALAVDKVIINNSGALVDAISDFTSCGIAKGVQQLAKVKDAFMSTYENLMDASSANTVEAMEFGADGKVTGVVDVVGQLRYSNQFRLYSGTLLDKSVGGWVPSNCYLYSALPGKGKSTVLMNIMLLVKDNPLNKLPDDMLQGRKGVMVYIGLENSLVQELKRILSFYGYNSEAVESMSDEKIIEVAGSYIANSPSGLDLIIMKYDRGTISAMDLKNILLDIEKRGKKVVLVCTDYADLFKYVPNEEDRKTNTPPLTKKVEEHKKVAESINCAVITAAQINRDGETAIKEAMRSSLDPLRRTHAGHLQGSHASKQKVDYLAFVHADTTEGIRCLAIKEDKQRDEISGVRKDYYIAPFTDNGFRIGSKCYSSAEEMMLDNNNEGGEVNENMKTTIDIFDKASSGTLGDIADDILGRK